MKIALSAAHRLRTMLAGRLGTWVYGEKLHCILRRKENRLLALGAV